ncbi:lactococcin 972 family bacteriocin [Paludifilum halophilum]
MLGVAVTSVCALAFVAAPSADAASGGVELTSDKVTAFGSKKVGGGTWSYGTERSGWRSQYKTVWSNYWHPDEVHGSSAQLGSRTPDRDCRYADKESKASQTAKTSDTGYAYWNTSCSNPH